MQAWNGQYMGVGNGGAGGFINYTAANGPSLAEALRDGFAASSTDTGHRGDDDDFSFARGHREQRIDYHYRGIHEMALRRRPSSKRSMASRRGIRISPAARMAAVKG